MVFINHSEVMGGNVAVVKIDGPLDGYTSPDFEDYIYQLLNKNIRYILFDALKLEYVSSEGIGLVLYLQKKISEENGFFVIFNLSDEIKALYEVLGFDKVFRIAEDQSEAMQVMDRQIELRQKGNDQGYYDIKVMEEDERGPGPVSEQVFHPFVIECANCRTLVRIKQSGDYLCPACKTEFTILPDQTAVF